MLPKQVHNLIVFALERPNIFIKVRFQIRKELGIKKPAGAGFNKGILKV